MRDPGKTDYSQVRDILLDKFYRTPGYQKGNRVNNGFQPNVFITHLRCKKRPKNSTLHFNCLNYIITVRYMERLTCKQQGWSPVEAVNT